MFRKLLTFVLLVPLSLNGLWIVCAEAEASEAPPSPKPAASSASDTEAMPACAGAAMCPLHKAAAAKDTSADTQEKVSAQSQIEPTGAICLIAPDGKSTSIAAIGFLYAPPVAASDFGCPTAVILQAAENPSYVFSDALLPDDTPPPRA